MRPLLAALLALPLLAGAGSGYGDGTCPPDRFIFEVGTFPAVVYVETYGAPFPGTLDQSQIWLYAESGVREGLQVGANQVLLGPTYGHERTCYWMDPSEHDILIF